MLTLARGLESRPLEFEVRGLHANSCKGPGIQAFGV